MTNLDIKYNVISVQYWWDIMLGNYLIFFSKTALKYLVLSFVMNW